MTSDETGPAAAENESKSETGESETETETVKTRATKSRSTSKGKHRSKAKPSTQDEILASFAACARCSFFLAGYQLIHDDFKTAADNLRSGWLELTWNSHTRELLHKCYGSRIDLEAFHYAGCCPNCWRPYVFQTASDDSQKHTFRLQVIPG